MISITYIIIGKISVHYHYYGRNEYNDKPYWLIDKWTTKGNSWFLSKCLILWRRWNYFKGCELALIRRSFLTYSSNSFTFWTHNRGILTLPKAITARWRREIQSSDCWIRVTRQSAGGNWFCHCIHVAYLWRVWLLIWTTHFPAKCCVLLIFRNAFNKVM